MIHQELRRMLGAAIASHSSHDASEFLNQDCRNYLFMFANILLHELAHVFITYLGKGVVNTPKLIGVLVYPGDTTSRVAIDGKEAGRCLEHLTFGGRMEFLIDPSPGTALSYVSVDTVLLV